MSFYHVNGNILILIKTISAFQFSFCLTLSDAGLSDSPLNILKQALPFVSIPKQNTAQIQEIGLFARTIACKY